MIPILGADPGSDFPPVEQALDYPQGLLAAGGDLSPDRLINAYRHGIFPWYSEGEPILWWSPTPRCVIFPPDVHISRRLRRQYNQGRFSLSADREFDRVIKACAEPRAQQDGTWITDDMVTAYNRLHQIGVAHSVEVWVDNELAGGIYGLALGRVFFGESMFSRTQDASKIALLHCVASYSSGVTPCLTARSPINTCLAWEPLKFPVANFTRIYTTHKTRIIGESHSHVTQVSCQAYSDVGFSESE